MKAKKITFISLSLVLILAFLLSGCSAPTAAPMEAPSNEAAAPTEQPQVAQPAQTEAAQPAASSKEISENVGVYAISSDLPSMDPPYMLAADTIYGFNVYETLTLWTPDKGIIPVLATSWESNPDGTLWNFKIREGVTFHDGTPLTAQDVKASLDRNIEIGMVAYDFIGIDSIEVVDDHTVRFTASAPRNLPLILSASYGMFIYSASAAEKGEDWFAAGNDAGSGPYKLESFEAGSKAVLTSYENYWGGWEDGQFTTVILEVVEDPTVRDQKIRSGEADITEELPFDSLEALKQVEGITVLPWLAQNQMVAAFALKNAPLDNLKVREALEYTFPYESVNESVFRGYGTVPPGFGPTSLWKPPADFPRYTFDLEKAKGLLKEAGFEKGFELNLGLSAGAKEIMDIANLWQAELAKIDVKLNIQSLASGAFWDYAYNPDQTDFNILMVAAGGDVPSPYSFLIIYTSNPLGWFPAIVYKNDKFDKLVFDAWAKEATDTAAASDLWIQAQRILHDDAVSVFILDYPYLMAFRNDVVGFVPNSPYIDIIFWYDLKRAAP